MIISKAISVLPCLLRNLVRLSLPPRLESAAITRCLRALNWPPHFSDCLLSCFFPQEWHASLSGERDCARTLRWDLDRSSLCRSRSSMWPQLLPLHHSSALPYPSEMSLLNSFPSGLLSDPSRLPAFSGQSLPIPFASLANPPSHMWGSSVKTG